MVKSTGGRAGINHPSNVTLERATEEPETVGSHPHGSLHPHTPWGGRLGMQAPLGGAEPHPSPAEPRGLQVLCGWASAPHWTVLAATWPVTPQLSLESPFFSASESKPVSWEHEADGETKGTKCPKGAVEEEHSGKEERHEEIKSFQAAACALAPQQNRPPGA